MAVALNKEKLLKHVEKLTRQFSIDYQESAVYCANRIIEYIKAGYTIVESVDNAIKDTNFLNDYKDNLKSMLLTAVADGYGILPNLVAKPALIKNTLLHKTWTSDRMPLSTRLHGTDAKMRQSIIDTVASAMRRGKSFTEMARNLADGYGSGQVLQQAQLPKYLKDLENAARLLSGGDKSALKDFRKALMKSRTQVAKNARNGAPTVHLKAAYNELIQACTKLSSDAIDKAVMTAITERARYYAERIARTEMARAYTEGYFVKALSDPDVVAVRWVLGSNHPKFDICDLHSNANFYGLGNGVYPKHAYPSYPAHPHCRCMPQSVYLGELNREEPTKYNEAQARKWIRGLSAENRKDLMGVGGSADFAKTGKLSNVNNWAGHEHPLPRITKDMIEKKR